MKKEKFDVLGMTCASCQAHVDKAVRKLDGISLVNVNLLRNTMDVEYDEKKLDTNDIINAVSIAGYEAKPKDNTSNVINKKNEKDYSLAKLISSIIILLILMYFSMGNMMWGWKAPKVFDHHENPMGFALIQFILVLPILYIYRNYFISGFKNIVHKSLNMDTLITMGTLFSMLYGIYALFMISLGYTEYHMYLYFESAGMIVVFVSIGKYLEGLSKRKTTTSLERLMDLAPKTAVILKDGKEISVNEEDVKIDDILVVKKGDVVAVDGVIIEGSASIDQANITGESMPVFKEVGEEVYSSTTISAGYIKMRATKVGSDTSIEQIIKLVDEASNSKAPISKLADKISGIFVPVILSIALIVFIANIIYISIATPSYVSNTFETALNFAITVIVIACPCALGLATPVAIMVGTGKGAENGLLIKNAEILEKAHSIKTVVLDKTGTITNGKPSVVDFISYDDNIDLKGILYSFENKSEHPLSKAIVEYTKGSKEYEVNSFKSLDGKGIEGYIDNDLYKICNIKLLDNEDSSIREKMDKLAKLGKTPLIVLKNSKLIGLIGIKDEVKPDSKEAIEALKNNGVEVVMLTGDNRLTADTIAKELGINKVYSDVYPEDKANIIEELKTNDGNLVAMVGDGVNDAIALTKADLGIAIGGGSNVALDSADIILVRNSLMDVLNVISLSKRVLNTIKLGLFWAFFYNIICVVLATGIFYYISNGAFKMEPMYGSIAMSISSVSVVLNALTINLFKVKAFNKEIKKEEIKMNTITINVDGMMCSHCKKHVEDACNSVSGVVKSDASLENKNVVVSYQGDVSKEALVSAIKASGYEAK